MRHTSIHTSIHTCTYSNTISPSQSAAWDQWWAPLGTVTPPIDERGRGRGRIEERVIRPPQSLNVHTSVVWWIYMRYRHIHQMCSTLISHVMMITSTYIYTIYTWVRIWDLDFIRACCIRTCSQQARDMRIWGLPNSGNSSPNYTDTYVRGPSCPYAWGNGRDNIPCALSAALQWHLSIKDTLNKGHLSNEDTVWSPNYEELCTNLPPN